MTTKDLIEFLNLTKDQKETLLVSLGAPLASGVIILIGADSGFVAHTAFLNICVLAIVAILPAWFLNSLIWSVLSVNYICALARHSIHCLHIPRRLKEDLAHDFGGFWRMTPRSELPVRRISPGVTVFASYCASGIGYLAGGSLLLVYIGLVAISVGAAIIFRVLMGAFIRQAPISILREFWEVLLPPGTDATEVTQDVEKMSAEVLRVYAGEANPD